MKVFIQRCGRDCRNILNDALWWAVKHCCLIVVKDILCYGVPVRFIGNLQHYAAEKLSTKNYDCYKRMNTLLSMYEAKSFDHECAFSGLRAYLSPGNPSLSNVVFVMIFSVLVMVLLLLAFKRRRQKYHQVSDQNCPSPLLCAVISCPEILNGHWQVSLSSVIARGGLLLGPSC